VLFFILYLPFGAAGGFIGGPVQRAFSDAGVTTAAIGAVVSIGLLPQVLKVFWAPLVDTILNARLWYVLATLAVAAAIAAAGALPIGRAALLQLTLVSLATSISASFCGMAGDSLMAHATLPERRGAAGGWSQAGNLGGVGMGGGVGQWTANHTHSLPIAGTAVAALCLLCTLALVFAPRSTAYPRHASYLITLKAVAQECWSVCRSRTGLMALFVLVLPLGAGGAASLGSAISKEWRVSADLLAFVNGLSGLATASAAIIGGFICDRMDRKTAYVLFGVLGGLIAAATVFTPRTPEWFVVFAFAYWAALGLSYAGFSSVTLETIGRGAAATKYTLFASVSNIPVWLMPAIDGWADTRWSATGLLWTELAVAVASAALYAAVAALARLRNGVLADASASP
jgi:MFS family permease